ITLDLGDTHTINEVSYLPRQTGGKNGIMSEYKLYASTDGENFEEIESGEWDVDREEKQITFDPIEASYIKLEAIEGVGDYASAAEINVFTPKPDEMTVSA